MNLLDALTDRATRAHACEVAVVACAALCPDTRPTVHAPLPLSRPAGFVLDVILGEPEAPNDLEASVGIAANLAAATGALADDDASRALQLARDAADTTVRDLLALPPLDVVVGLLCDCNRGRRRVGLAA